MSTATTVVAWDSGIQVDTAGGGAWEPPVDPAPPTLAPTYATVQALVVDSVDTSGRRSIPTVRLVPKTRAAYRIVVGGKDVTWFRSTHTPLPTYSLIAPLLYGSGSLNLPQIHAALERPGYGALDWLKKFATVKVQRVDSDGNIVATDFRGFVADFPPNGRNMTVTLGGEASGLAAMADHDRPIFAPERDAGALGIQLVQHHLRLPVGGTPDTGIMLTETGGDSELAVLTDLLAKTTQRDGTQWTIMPNASGVYRMFQKDVATIDATAYIDGFRVTESLKRDFTEETNRIWASGVDEDGGRVNFAIFPGLSMGRDIFPGTVSPGDTGGPVIALIYRLFTVGYLDVRVGEWTTDGDDPVTDAVKDVQDDADLPRTGVVDSDTWDAMFDPVVTGYSVRRSQIKPAAQWPYTQAVLRSASGQVIRPNPKYDRSRPFVDATVDMGPGWSRRKIQRWAQHELANNSESPNWVGTVTINTGAVIDGTHYPGDPLPSAFADVRDARSLKPGMNLWLPNWDDGTLVHISGVNVSPGSVELAVDTRARDTMKVWEVIARNRESRKNPDRQWIAQNRRSGQRDDTGAFYDKSTFGKIEPTFCPANTWTIIASPAGKSGTIQEVNLSATSSQALYVAAAFGKQINADKLDSMIGDPLSVAGTKSWQSKAKTLHDDHYLAWAFGGKDDADTPGQFCGYWPLHVTGKTITTTRTGTATASTNAITVTGHGYSNGSRVTISGTVPAGLSSTTYYVVSASTDTFEVSSTEGGSTIDITADASDVNVTRTTTEPPPPVTGDFQDKAGVPYFCKGAPVLWLAIYPDRDTVMQGGRVFELLLNDTAG